MVTSTGFVMALLAMNSAFARGEGGASTSAGILERQMQLQFNLKDLTATKPIPLLEYDIPEEILEIPEGISVYISQINVVQNFPLLNEQIAKVLPNFENRVLSSQDLLDLCESIRRLYSEAGYITAWVYPPVQKVENNSLTIVVMEGVLGQIDIEGNTSYKKHFIRKFFESQEGEPINYNALMKALLILNENSDISVEAILKTSPELGYADLVLNVTDKRPAHITVGYNNWGSSSTSFNQPFATMIFGNLATSGDTLTLQTSVDAPPVYYYFNPVYSIPLTGSGARMDVSFLFSNSNTQGDDLEQYNLTSWSEIITATYKQPLMRTRNMGTDLFLSFDYKQYKNMQDGFQTSFDKLRVMSVGGKVDFTDSVKGRNTFDAYFHAGIPYLLGGLGPVSDQCSREGAGARYFIFNVDYQRVQPISDCMFVITTTGQGTFNKIPTSEQYSLGGMGTVRGYTSAIACGDVGYCANFEFYFPPPGLKNVTFKPLKKTWGEVMQLLTFIDHGGIYTVSPVPGELSGAYLTSVGAGLRFYGPRNLNISFDAGFPVMHQYKTVNSILYVKLSMDLL
jgi:hemolysin activation/secretion protein